MEESKQSPNIAIQDAGLHHPGEPMHPTSAGLWKTLSAIWLSLLLISLATTAAASRNYPDPGTGELLFASSQHEGFTPSTLLGTDYRLSVTGLIVQTRLTQTFSNDTGDWQEALYVFPLPEKAAVYHMEIVVGDRRIMGEIKEKEEAERVYNQAKQEGKRAAVVHQNRPNMFTQKVANIPPGETIQVELHYQHQVDFHAGQFSLSLPTTITPRYIPGSRETMQNPEIQEGQDPQTDLMVAGLRDQFRVPTETGQQGWQTRSAVADAEDITPVTVTTQSLPAQSHRARIAVTLRPGLPLADIVSQTHEIDWQHSSEGYQVSVAGGSIRMDRDFVIHWQVEDSLQPQAAVFTEVSGSDRYAQIMVVPPRKEDTSLALPREMIWVIDTSGSMEGVSIEQAKAALIRALDSLNPEDRFNVIEFNSRARSLFPQAVPAQQHAMTQARRFVQRLQADGGTEIASALNLALSEQAPSGYVRQVIFLTDGSVGNETQLFRQISDRIGDSRLFTVGIGPAPNRFFMRKAAQFGRGSYRHIQDIGEVESKVDELTSLLRFPSMRDIRISTGQQADSRMDYYPRQIPDLYQGDPLMLLIRLDGSATGSSDSEISVEGFAYGIVQGQQALWSRQLSLSDSQPQSGIARAWAREKIGHLMDLKTLGSDEKMIRSQVVPLALENRLMSAYTSFVAVDETPVRSAEEELKQSEVANLLPAGLSKRMASFPRTATPSALYMQAGVLLLLCGLGLMIWQRRLESRSEQWL